jgi:hypothetical protein
MATVFEDNPTGNARRRYWMAGAALLLLVGGAALIFVALKPTTQVKGREQDAKGKLDEAKGKEPNAKADNDPSHYPPGPPSGISAIKYVTERPPETEECYRSKYGESPTLLLYSTVEKVYYSYSHGERMYWNPPTQLWHGGTPK